MKRSEIVILAVVAGAVFITALGISLYITEARHKNRAVESKTVADSNVAGGQRSLIPGRADRGRVRNLSEEERTGLVEERKQAVEKWKSMSGEEKQQFRTQLREKFNARRRGEMEKTRIMTPEEKAKLDQKWQTMSEQEREEFKAKIRAGVNVVGQDPNIVQQEPNAVRLEPNIVR